MGLFAILWLDLIRLLSGPWDAREQYAYGWFVPFFAAALFWRRWIDRPVSRLTPDPRPLTPDTRPLTPAPLPLTPDTRPLTPDSGPLPPFSSDSRSPSFPQLPSVEKRGIPELLPIGFIFILCLLLLPLRVIYEINRDWPLISWVYTTIVVIITLYILHLAGPRSAVSGPFSKSPQSPVHSPASHPLTPDTGPLTPVRSPSSSQSPQSIVHSPWSLLSPWVKHFAFPVAFILVAVVWPYRIEKGLTQGLMQIVATLTVELLGWLDIPALQRGNLIDLATGTVGVDEACSGIRSFQSSLMAALLMGELYRFRLLPRAVLVLSGLAVGFCFNVVRTLILSYQANAHGMSAIDKWHDPAGMTITVACFFALWAFAILIRKYWSTALTPGLDLTPDSRPPTPVSSALTPDPRPLTPFSTDPRPLTPGLEQPPVTGQWSVVSSPPARAFMLALGAWSLLALFATEAWYRSHANPNSGKFYWSAVLPESNPTFKEIKLPPRTLELLSFDQGAVGQWTIAGADWSMFFFRWNPRSIQSVIQARMHRPEVCLPASGFSLIAESEPVSFSVAGLQIPFRKYIYQAQSQTIYVFFCQWEDAAEHQAGMQSSKQADRLQSVLSGRRTLGQQTLEIIISGTENQAAAEQQLREHLPSLIRREPVSPSPKNPAPGAH